MSDKNDKIILLREIDKYKNLGIKYTRYLNSESSYQEINFELITMILDYVKILFDNLDDKKDIINEIYNIYKINDYFNLDDVLICYKEYNEYGMNIEIYHKKIHYYYIFVSNLDGKKSITSFYNVKNKTGLLEKIYSNRTEHYIDNNYHSTNFCDYIMKEINKYTKIILEDKKYPELYDFIINKNKNITMISTFFLNFDK